MVNREGPNRQEFQVQPGKEKRTMNVENIDSCSQKNSAERKEYVRTHRLFNRI